MFRTGSKWLVTVVSATIKCVSFNKIVKVILVKVVLSYAGTDLLRGTAGVDITQFVSMSENCAF